MVQDDGEKGVRLGRCNPWIMASYQKGMSTSFHPSWKADVVDFGVLQKISAMHG